MSMSAEEWKQRLADLERSGQPMSLQDEYEAARRLGGKRGSTLVLNSRHVTWQRRRLRTASFTGTASTALLTPGRRPWRQCFASSTSTYSSGGEGWGSEVDFLENRVEGLGLCPFKGVRCRDQIYLINRSAV